MVESWLVKVGKRGKEGGKREGKGRRLVPYGMYRILCMYRMYRMYGDGILPGTAENRGKGIYITVTPPYAIANSLLGKTFPPGSLVIIRNRTPYSVVK